MKIVFTKIVVYLLILFIYNALFISAVYSLGRTTTPGYCDGIGEDYFASEKLCCIKGMIDDPSTSQPWQIDDYCNVAPSNPTVCLLNYSYNPKDGLCYSHDPSTTDPDLCDSDHQLVGDKCCPFDSVNGIDFNNCISTSQNCPTGYDYDTSAGKCVEKFADLGSPTGEPGDPITLSAEPCDYNGSKGIQTALGCIPYEPVSLIGWVLRWAIGVGGGIAFLLMAFASYQLMTSAGNPERLKAGQEMFVSAGAGLLFIIFSVFLLQLIGADILKIPGFNP